MKQKLCNRILGIYNSILFFTLLVLNSNIKDNSFLKYKFNSTPNTADFQNTIYLLSALIIFTIIVNLIFLIINRKSKKMVCCFIIPILFYSVISLATFKLDLSKIFDFLVWSIIPVLIINLIYEITHRKNSNSVALQVVGTIICIILVIAPLFTEHDYTTLIIGLVLSSIMLLIYSKETIDTSKTVKIINNILIALLTLLLIAGISLFFIAKSNLHKVDDEIDAFLNTIKSGIEQENNSEKDRLIAVCKNDKWGYINTSGKEIIPCEYDAVSLEYDYYGDIVKYDFYILKKGNEFSIISNSGKILYKQNGSPTPWDRVYFKNKYDSIYGVTSELNSDRLDIQRRISEITKSYIGYVNSPENTILEPDDSLDNDYNDSEYVYSYNVGDNYILEFKEIDLEDLDTKYNMTLKKDGKTIEGYNNISLGSTNPYKLETYSNGDIPFYSFENNFQGYYSRKNHKFEILKGKYEILDVIDDNVIIRDWKNSSNTKDLLVNNEKGILLKANQICTYKNGYLVKKENGKSVLLDKNLNELTDEFDVIFDIYKNYGIFICVNSNGNKNEYVLVNSQGKGLATTHYDIIYYDYNSELDDIEYKDYVISDLHNAYENQYSPEDF